MFENTQYDLQEDKHRGGGGMKKVSNCCKALILTAGGNEGTYYWKCSSCLRPCDVYSPKTGKSFFDLSLKKKKSIVSEAAKESNRAQKATVNQVLKPTNLVVEKLMDTPKENMKKNKTNLPIGILPLRIRWKLSKTFFLYGLMVLVGNAWTENLADVKTVIIKHTLKVKK